MNISKLDNGNPNFRAKFYNYPYAFNHPDIAKGFEEATKQYPDYALLQDSISCCDKDHFFLLKNNQVKAFDTAPLTKIRTYLNGNNEVVEKLVEIFNGLLKKSNK